MGSIKANREGKLKGRIAVVTGASRRKGIGAAIAKTLAAEGADIFFTYWSGYDAARGIEPDEPLQLQSEIHSFGIRCASLEADFAKPDTYRIVLDEVENQLGQPDILINNACHSERDGFENLHAGLLDAHYAVNVRAAALLSVEFARRFSKGKGGRIINLSSGQSLGPMIGEIAYAMTKGAVETLTVTLAAEIAHKGITVNAVNPGPTDTGWMTEEFKQQLAARFPSGRVGRPEDAARLISFLASDEAEWITGQVIHSEGGFRRG